MRRSRCRRFLFCFQRSERHHSVCEGNSRLLLPTIARVIRRGNALTRVSDLAGVASCSNCRFMARDEDSFRIRPGKVRDRGGARLRPGRIGGPRRRPTSFLGEVQQAIRRAGGDPNRLPGSGGRSGRFNARGRGAKVVASFARGGEGWSQNGSGVRFRARRVVVKARVV